MKLNLDSLGRITKEYPTTFFRLTNWMTGTFVADYSTESEAVAASYASKNGTMYDHKVSKMSLTSV